MAVFNNLHDVGQHLADVLTLQGLPAVQVGPAPEAAVSITESIRLTLLWLTPQPGHRNDPPAMGPDGVERAPVSLTTYFLVTTYGSNSDDDPIQAHNRLGQVLQIFHQAPVLEPPAPSAGELSVVHIPTDADLTEKVYSSLQVGLRPWAVLEVAPVQLRDPELLDPTVHPVVRPGGLNLGPVEAIAPPTIRRITPATARQSALVRIDASYEGTPVVAVDGEPLPGAAVTVVDDVIFANLATVAPGAHDVTLAIGSPPPPPLTSPAAYLTVADPPAASVNAPNPGFHSIASGDLTLFGQDLAAADRVILWPDEGLSAPSEVVTLTPVTAQPNQVDVAQALVDGAALRPTVYRVTVGVGPHTYTPWVLLEVRP